MNSTVIARQAMKLLAQEPSIDEQVHVLGKIIRDFEKIPDESSHRLCQDLRANLKRIRETPGATSDQIRDALGLLKRVRGFDPRRAKAEQEKEDDAVDPSRREYDPKDRLADAIAKNRTESKLIPDGYKKDVLDLPAVIALVRDRFSSTPKYEDDVLAVALPGASDELLIQLYLSIASSFKELGGAFVEGKYGRDLLPPAAQWIVNSLARKSQTVAFPRPNCFSFSEEIAFRTV